MTVMTVITDVGCLRVHMASRLVFAQQKQSAIYYATTYANVSGGQRLTCGMLMMVLFHAQQ